MESKVPQHAAAFYYISASQKSLIQNGCRKNVLALVPARGTAKARLSRPPHTATLSPSTAHPADTDDQNNQWGHEDADEDDG
jgi:hypothetical protein